MGALPLLWEGLVSVYAAENEAFRPEMEGGPGGQRTQACRLSAESLETDGHMPEAGAGTWRPGVHRGGQGERPCGGGTAVLSVSRPSLQRGSPGSDGYFPG